MAHSKADPGALARAHLPAGPLLVLEVPDLETADGLDPGRDPQFVWFSTHWPMWNALRESGRSVAPFRVWVPDACAAIEPTPKAALLFMQKSRERLEMTLEGIATLLGEGGLIQVVGTKDEGITSAPRSLGAFATLHKSVSGKHARLVSGRVLASEALRGAGEGLNAFRREWTANLALGASLELVSFPGVFSHGRLDDGTRLLLETVQDLPGPLLDVGCGSGVVGLWYRQRGTPSVTLLDADAAAVEAARASWARLSAPRGPQTGSVRVVAGDGLTPGDVPRPDAPPMRFQSIVSNPPFHQGVSTYHRVTARLIAEAPQALLPGGTLTLVCNRFLPVLDPLDRAFGGHRILADDGRYRVVQATR